MKSKEVFALCTLLAWCLFSTGCGSEWNNSFDTDNSFTNSGNNSAGDNNNNSNAGNNSSGDNNNNSNDNISGNNNNNKTDYGEATIINGFINQITVVESPSKEEVPSEETSSIMSEETSKDNADKESAADEKNGESTSESVNSEPAEENSGNSGGDAEKESAIIQPNRKFYIYNVPFDLRDAEGNIVWSMDYKGDVYVPVGSLTKILGTLAYYDPVRDAVYIGSRPVLGESMLDIVEGYDCQNFKQYSSLKSGGNEFFYLGGKPFSNGSVLTADKKNPAYASFALDGRFSKFRFMIGHLDNARMYDVVLRIFVDGEEKLEDESGSRLGRRIKAETYYVNNETIEIDVSGANHLRIVMESRQEYSTSYAMVNMELIHA